MMDRHERGGLGTPPPHHYKKFLESAVYKQERGVIPLTTPPPYLNWGSPPYRIVVVLIFSHSNF